MSGVPAPDQQRHGPDLAGRRSVPVAEDGSGGSFGTLLLWAFVLAAAGTVPLSPWLAEMDPYHAFLAGSHVLLCALGAALSIYDRFRPVLLVASTFPFCWLVVPSVFQISQQLAAWGDPGVTLNFSATLRGQLILVVGQLCLLVGYLCIQRPGRATEAWEIDDTVSRRMLVLAAVFATCAALLIPFVAAQAGGIGALFTSRSELNQSLSAQGIQQADQATRALVKTVPSAFATASIVIALWIVRSAPRGDRLRRRAVVLASATFLILLVVANPFVYSRFQVLAAFGPALVAVLRPRSRRSGGLWLVGSVAAFLLIYPAASYFRLGTTASTSADPLLASKDFDGFQQTINTVTFVDVHGAAHGLHLFSGLFFFVPRALWEGKARPGAFEVAYERGYNFQNLSMPFPAEAYLDGGWPGVVVVLALLGAIFGILDRAWIHQTRLSVLAAYFSLAQVGLWRGPFGSLAPVFGFAIALLVLSLVWGSVSRRRDAMGGSGDVREDVAFSDRLSGPPV